MTARRLNLLTSRRWTYVLAKPLHGTAAGVFHIADWRLPTRGLCGSGLVRYTRPERRTLPDGSPWYVTVPDEDGAGGTTAFADGTARRALPAEATCRRCRSIMRHHSARALPVALARELADEEYAERERAARRAARAAGQAPPAAPSTTDGALFALPAPTGTPGHQRPRTGPRLHTPASTAEQLTLFAAWLTPPDVAV